VTSLVEVAMLREYSERAVHMTLFEREALRLVLDRYEALEARAREVDRDPHGATERQVDALLERNPNLAAASWALRGAAAEPASVHMAPAFRLAADRADATRLHALKTWAADAKLALCATFINEQECERARDVLSRMPGDP